MHAAVHLTLEDVGAWVMMSTTAVAQGATGSRLFALFETTIIEGLSYSSVHSSL